MIVIYYLRYIECSRLSVSLFRTPAFIAVILNPIVGQRGRWMRDVYTPPWKDTYWDDPARVSSVRNTRAQRVKHSGCDQNAQCVPLCVSYYIPFNVSNVDFFTVQTSPNSTYCIFHYYLLCILFIRNSFIQNLSRLALKKIFLNRTNFICLAIS